MQVGKLDILLIVGSGVIPLLAISCCHSAGVRTSKFPVTDKRNTVCTVQYCFRMFNGFGQHRPAGLGIKLRSNSKQHLASPYILHQISAVGRKNEGFGCLISHTHVNMDCAN
ncbi:hypothetical protein D3C75_745260 [compost metagenome]